METKNLSPAVRLAQDITVLHMLSEVPEPTARQPRRSPNHPTKNRVLSLPQEQDLTSTLAFLSGVSHDGNHVTAVAVEEVNSGRGLRMWLAINKMVTDSNQAELSRLQQAFEGLFKSLARASKGMWPCTSIQIYAALVAKPHRDSQQAVRAVRAGCLRPL